jgi:hypothetical protein
MAVRPLEQRAQVASGRRNRIRGVIGAGIAVVVAVDAVAGPTQFNLRDGRPWTRQTWQQPKGFTPVCTPGAGKRPGSDSMAPIAASTVHAAQAAPAC